jgi:hypothetical protein
MLRVVADYRKDRFEMLKAPSKPKRCPWCNSNFVAQIIHEINSLTPAAQKDLDDCKVVLGVSLKERANPKWQCMDCGAQIYGHDAPSLADAGLEAFVVGLATKDAKSAKPCKKGH